MIRSLIYILVSLAIICGLTFCEQSTLESSFNDLKREVAVIKEKAQSETVAEKDVKKLQDKWIKQKEILHVFIPHNEIKEVDLWLSECLYYSRKSDYAETNAKAEVLSELFEQIPKTFSFRIENLL